MRQVSNAHTHSTWCDGNDTLQELAEAALALGFSDLGFSSHAPAPFDATCPGIGNEAAYRADVHAVRDAFAGRLNILCGIEQDFAGPVERAEYEYVIGSSHYLRGASVPPVAVDGDSGEQVRHTIDQYYHGDGLAMAKAYFGSVVQGVGKYRPDIVGHFDLLTKYNGGGALFDESGAAYRDMALQALDAVLDIQIPAGGMVEVNTGAMARGLRSAPYPAAYLLRHAAQRNARMIITTDCHDRTSLGYGFTQALGLLQKAGFGTMAVLQNGKFVDVKI